MAQNLLISEPPLQVLPSLAVKVGLNEAIILQQFHYWLQRSTNVRDGYKWVYNSYKEWNKQFPFWGLNTLKRAITSLEKSGYLISGNYNKAGFDKTKWYRINYDLLDMGQRSTQNGSTMNPEWVDGAYQNGSTNTNRLPENTTIDKKGPNHVSKLDTECIQPVSTGKVRLGKVSKDIDKDSKEDKRSLAKAKQFPWKTVIDYLNQKTNKHFRYTEANKRLILARSKETFSLDDMKKVIDNKCRDWLNDNQMNQYLRPATLFSTSKFEGYLNSQSLPSEPHVSNQSKPSKPKNKIDNKKKDLNCQAGSKIGLKAFTNRLRYARHF